MASFTQRFSRQLAVPLALTILVFTSGFSPLESLFAPNSNLIPRWADFNTESTETVNQNEWATFIQKYREENYDGIARIAYHRVSFEDRLALKEHLKYLQGIQVSNLNRNQQLAYWINLYNATTVNLILEHMPVESIRDINISPGLFASGPWGKKLLRIEGEKVSLNDIEHGILRPGWKDPRIHYALNCASLGCPDLPKEVITAVEHDAQLTAAARRFIDHSRAVSIGENNEAIVSSIYVWFKEDFGGSDAAVLDHLRTYASKERQKELMKIRSIENHTYDWGLNSVPAVATASTGS
ncbi:DUF547 domain-containing protein [Kiloniella sp. EL199]|uniref:DUF547 domain-containing protein n=1 Tax=Kiloniella sp. EL199 TaxID=2107581 RepID=UPI000EA18F5C|nr:DUF547 domain-containing protein [Kiloniella sp. EL199]